MAIAYRRGQLLQLDNDVMVFERGDRGIECGDGGSPYVVSTAGTEPSGHSSS